jgi:hypothetical protein
MLPEPAEFFSQSLDFYLKKEKSEVTASQK